MIALGWNCREFGNPKTVNALHDIVQRWDPKIVFLLETKLRKKAMERAKARVGFVYGSIVPKSNRSGGLAMLWRKRDQSRHHGVCGQLYRCHCYGINLRPQMENYRFLRTLGNPQEKGIVGSIVCFE